MMRTALLLAALATCGCTENDRKTASAVRQEALRDIESYAVGSCLAYQNHPYLKDQGDAWASAIIQRSQVNLDVFGRISSRIEAENKKGDMVVVRSETQPSGDLELPLLYCHQIIDQPAVRAEINKAVEASIVKP
jgi:hypothetical protein